MTVREVRQMRAEAVSLVHYARAQLMDTFQYGPEGPEFVGKAAGRAARFDMAAVCLSKAAWTLRGKDLDEVV